MAPYSEEEEFDYDELIYMARQSDSSWPRLLGRAIEKLIREKSQETVLMHQRRDRVMAKAKEGDINPSNMFEIASRAKLRFKTPRGLMSTEDLWDIPLRSRDDFNLDIVAKTVNKELAALTEESFVDTMKSPAQGRLELQLDLVKYVIQTKKAEEEEAKAKAEKRQLKKQLTDALAKKQLEEMSDLDVAELKKKIAALGDD